jgi:c-di-GMP-binding flagellar brake protein YcgR
MQRERRRTVRVELGSEERVRLEVRHRVQLLDISLTGALLASEVGLAPGSTARFRAALDNQPIAAEIRVRREQPGVGPNAHVGLGTMFLSMDDATRRNLEQFLRRARE